MVVRTRKQIEGLGMRAFLTVVLVAVLLAGCGAQQPNDQDQYFDNINPDPTGLQATSDSAPQTVQLPTDQTSSPTNDMPVAPVVLTENANISNTQDFKAVKEQETIASDKAKLAVLKESYQVVQPVSLPRRDDTVNLAAYALSQKQALGTRVFRRNSSGPADCGRYRKDPDAAQRAFLAAGGPEKDGNQLDNDGDGFACDWNPDTYRRLLQN
jgi:hypothetical protein